MRLALSLFWRRGILGRGLNPVSRLARRTAFVAMALGMAAMLAALSVMGGFEKEYRQSILAFNAHLILTAPSEEEGMWEKVDAALRRDEVVARSPFVFREGLVATKEGLAGIVLKGIDPESFKKVYPLRFESVEGGELDLTALEGAKERPPVIVGRKLYEALEGEGGLRLFIGKSGAEGLRDLAHDFKIAGTFESGLYEFDSQFVLASLGTMNRVFPEGSRRDGYEVRLRDPMGAERVRASLADSLPLEVDVLSWQELNEPLFAALKLERSVFLVMMALLFLLAATNMSGVLFMVILEQRREASVLRALGLTRSRLARIFDLQGWGLSLISLMGGLGLAALVLTLVKRSEWVKLDPQIYFVSSLPLDLAPSLWLGLFALAGGICLAVVQVSVRTMLRSLDWIEAFR